VQFRFADFVLDTDRRELTRQSEPVPLGPQVFDLLVYLLQNRERVVSKDDLLETVWQGRIVSESTLTSHINAVRKAIGDTGEEQRLIRTVARKGFRFVGAVAVAGTSADKANVQPASQPFALAPPDRPSIAVLPFQNLSGDPDQDYFADGVVEDIITGLSRIKWLFVIARNSSFTYKGRAVDVKQVGRELGVRYILEGSVRKAANRVRISGQLIDASMGAHIWADRFEGTLDDIFDLQDRITASVIGAAEPNLRQAEIERAKRKRPESLDAYDHYLRAFPHAYANNPEDGRIAVALLDEALRLEPSYASAHGLAAWCHQQLYRSGSDETNKKAALRHAAAAVIHGGDDATALSMAGFVLAAVGHDHEAAISATDRSLALNASARSFAFSAIVRGFSGQYDMAIEHALRAIRLNPLDPMGAQPYVGLAFSYLALGRFEESAEAAAKAIQLNPRFSVVRALNIIALMKLGRPDRAHTAAGQLLALMPEFRAQMLTGLIPQQHIIADWSAALQSAGIPE
jgi:TolB-like protein/tetratricopeptide (TPR) repeat protein